MAGLLELRSDCLKNGDDFMFYFYVLYFVNSPQITMSVTELNLIELINKQINV